MIVTWLMVAVAFVIGGAAGRVTRRGHIDRRVRDPRLWWSIAIVMLLVNSFSANVFLGIAFRDAEHQLNCRADLSSPVNSATATLNAATGRGLAVEVAIALKNPAVAAAVRAHLGSASTSELVKQIDIVLSSSSAIEAANAARGNPVEKCE